MQLRTHSSIYRAVLEHDDMVDRRHTQHVLREKLTLAESIVGLVVGFGCVSLVAVSLDGQVNYLVEERGISDA